MFRRRNYLCEFTAMLKYVATTLLLSLIVVTPAQSACRVSDFTDRTLASLNELQRLSFISQMTQIEFNRLKSAKPDSENYSLLVVNSTSVRDAQEQAWLKLEATAIENFDDLRKIWASDYLSDEQLVAFTDCVSNRQPGLTYAGRAENPAEFHLTFAHVTPIGIEQIVTRVVASHNIANIAEFEEYLHELGPQDNYTARTFALKKSDPGKRAVLIMRAGWETPDFIYIPRYPASAYSSDK